MRLVNHTKYPTDALRRIITAVYRGERFRLTAWRSMEVVVEYSRTPPSLKGQELSCYARRTAVVEAVRALLSYAESPAGELAGCKPPPRADDEAVDLCNGRACTRSEHCSAVRQFTLASSQLDRYLSLYTTRGAHRWSRRFALYVPRQSLDVGTFVTRVDYALRITNGMSATLDEAGRGRLSWLAELGVPEELREEEPRQPTQDERAAERHRKRAKSIASLEARKKAWITKRTRSENALKKIERELKRLRTLEAKDTRETP
jgi:hypothetical protein